jgi:hypothetical protein
MVPIDNTAFSDTANYDQWPGGTIFGAYGILATSTGKTNMATYLARTAVNFTNAMKPSYVLITPSMIAANTAYGYIDPADINTLLAQLRTSPYWKAIVNTHGTVIYQLTAAANTIPSGPYNAKVWFTVP